MRQVYTPVRASRNPVIPVLGALALTGLVFLILPLTQMLSNAHKDRKTFTRVELSLPPPPPPPDLVKPPEERQAPPETPQLEQPAQRLSLDQLALALNPTMGGVGPKVNTDLSFAMEKVDAIQELKIFEISEVDRQARVTFFPKPEYPVSLQHVRDSVKAVLTFVVNADGTVSTVEAVSDVSHPEFTPVLRDWVKQWRFEAASKSGQPVPQRVRQRVQLKPD